MKNLHLKEDYNIANIKPGLRQVFKSPFTLNIGQRELIKFKNNGVIRDYDLEVAKFLFKFKFATLDQLYVYMSQFEERTKVSLRNRLNKLVKYKVLNKFMLTEDVMVSEMQPDVLEIFCLDLGGRYLLANYSKEDTSDWYSIVNMKDSILINKDLAVVEFYLSLIRDSGEKLEYFNVEPDMRMGRKNMIPSFDFCFNVGGNKTYYIGEVVRDDEFPIEFRDRANKFEELLVGKAWMKYYYDTKNDPAPVLFIIADSDRLAFEVGELIANTSDLERFRLTTDERMKNPLYEAGSFMRYSKEENILQQIKASSFKS